MDTATNDGTTACFWKNYFDSHLWYCNSSVICEMGATICYKRHRSIYIDTDSPLSIVYPAYFTNDEITEQDVKLTTSSWQIVMNGEETEAFLQHKNDPSFQHATCLTWFFDSFYGRFFEIAPDAKPLFSNVSIIGQGRLISGVITSALNMLGHKAKLEEKLISVATNHAKYGIKTTHYGLMGEALVWALGNVLGSIFDSSMVRAWLRVYSFILSIILPVATAAESKLGVSSAPKFNDKMKYFFRSCC